MRNRNGSYLFTHPHSGSRVDKSFMSGGINSEACQEHRCGVLGVSGIGCGKLTVLYSDHSLMLAVATPGYLCQLTAGMLTRSLPCS